MTAIYLASLRVSRSHLCVNSIRQLHASRPGLAPPQKKDQEAPEEVSVKKDTETISVDTAMEMLDKDFEEDDTPSGGHILLRQRREMLQYLRLIEHDMRGLVVHRKDFVPPTPAEPLIVRSLDYAGEPHPVTAKRVLVVPVHHLPLRDEDAIHKLKVLAGVRWTPQPPLNAGVSSLAPWSEGFVKIACEKFPEPAMNLKWASDTLDRLITEANNPADKFANVPIDTRHIYAKIRNARKGEHLRHHSRPSLRDFPQEWLPNVEYVEPAF